MRDTADLSFWITHIHFTSIFTSIFYIPFYIFREDAARL